MASAYKRLFSGYGTPHVPLLAYTVPALTSTVLREVQVTNPGFAGGNGVPMPDVTGICQGASGMIYFTASHAIMKLSTTGQLSVLAGQPNVSGSNVLTGRAARFNTPVSCIVNAAETFLYVFDSVNGRVVRITIATGAVTLMPGAGGFTGGGISLTNTRQIALSPDESKILVPFLSSPGWRLCQINTTSPFAGTDVPTFVLITGTGVLAQGVVYSADGTKAYVAHQTTSSGIPIGNFTEVTLSTGASVNVVAGSVPAGSGWYTEGYVDIAKFSPFLSFVMLPVTDGIGTFYGVTTGVSAVRSLYLISSGVFYLTTPVGKQNFNAAAVGESAMVAGYPGTARTKATCVAKSYNGNNLLIGCNGSIMVHSLETSYTSILAGYSISVSPSYIEGTTPYLTDGAFNLYVVPNGEGLDVTKHRRFSNETVGLSTSWFAEIHKNLNAGDKIYFEALGFNLTLELSGLEVS